MPPVIGVEEADEVGVGISDAVVAGCRDARVGLLDECESGELGGV